jgi:accessory gene regulator protein AgrB
MKRKIKKFEDSIIKKKQDHHIMVEELRLQMKLFLKLMFHILLSYKVNFHQN